MTPPLPRREGSMTHEDLRKAAVRWLTNTKRCSVVLSEMVTAAWETPDAIGWRAGGSILVECKVSRSDFLRNKDKSTLTGERGMGCERFFLVPECLISESDMEIYPGYGLLWHLGDRISQVCQATRRETNQSSEILMLVSALRRIKTREFLTIVPDTGDVSDCAFELSSIP